MAVAAAITNYANALNPRLIRSFDGTFDIGLVITSTYGATISKRNVATGVWSAPFDLATIVGNPLSLPVMHQPSDGHYTLACMLDADNNCWVTGNSHNETLRLCYANVTSWPPSTTWTKPAFATQPWSHTLSGLDMCSYENMTRRTDGTVILDFAQENSLWTTDPTTYRRNNVMFKLPPHSTTWQPLVGAGDLIISELGIVPGQPNRAYCWGIINEVLASGVDRLHLIGQWANVDEATTGFYRQQSYYLYTDDLVTWRAAGGAPLTMPVTWANRAQCQITVGPAYGSNNGGFLIDGNGYPHFIAKNLDWGTSPQWMELYWDGAAWQQVAVSDTGIGNSVGPGIEWRSGQLWYSTEAGNRFRLLNVAATPAFVNIGGPMPQAACPRPEPVGMYDHRRVSFLLPDGDTPVVYEFAPNSNPRAPG